MNEREAFYKRYIGKDGKLKRKGQTNTPKESAMHITDEQAKETQLLVAKINALPFHIAQTMQTITDLLTRRATSSEYLDNEIIDTFMCVFVPHYRIERESVITGLLNDYLSKLNRPKTRTNVQKIMEHKFEDSDNDPTPDVQPEHDDWMEDVSSSVAAAAKLQSALMTRMTPDTTEEEPTQKELLEQIDTMTNELSTQLLLLENPRYRNTGTHPDFPAGSEDAIRYNLVKLNLIKMMVLMS